MSQSWQLSARVPHIALSSPCVESSSLVALCSSFLCLVPLPLTSLLHFSSSLLPLPFVTSALLRFTSSASSASLLHLVRFSSSRLPHLFFTSPASLLHFFRFPFSRVSFPSSLFLLLFRFYFLKRTTLKQVTHTSYGFISHATIVAFVFLSMRPPLSPSQSCRLSLGWVTLS